MATFDPTIDAAALAARIDHTLLRPDATEADVRRVAAEARAHGFAGVCVAATWVSAVASVVRGTAVKVVSVAGFPLGASPRSVKALEAKEAVRLGADEVDAVIHLGYARSGLWDAVLQDLHGVVEAADGRPVKAILETSLLGSEEIRRAAEVAERAGAAFVKTSTGFGPGGATVEVVRLLRAAVGNRLRVKASGGVRTLDQALALLAAGADRLGTSSGVAIVEEARSRQRSQP